MKLTSAQVERTLTQCEAMAIPDDHPLVPQLSDLFGEHTFFLDRTGLSIMEPATEMEEARNDVRTARVINLANWSDDSLTHLAVHEPEPTDAIIELVPGPH